MRQVGRSLWAKEEARRAARLLDCMQDTGGSGPARYFTTLSVTSTLSTRPLSGSVAIER